MARDKNLHLFNNCGNLIRVADLQTRTLHTLILTGIERILTSSRSLGQRTSPQPVRLEPVRLAPGKAEVVFDLNLPQGYKLNLEAPVTLRQVGDGTSQTFTFQPGEPVTWPVIAMDSRELILELTLYYCQEEDARLCLIHNRRFALPVVVIPGAPATASVAYQVEEYDP